MTGITVSEEPSTIKKLSNLGLSVTLDLHQGQNVTHILGTRVFHHRTGVVVDLNYCGHQWTNRLLQWASGQGTMAALSYNWLLLAADHSDFIPFSKIHVPLLDATLALSQCHTTVRLHRQACTFEIKHNVISYWALRNGTTLKMSPPHPFWHYQRVMLNVTIRVG
uniref:(California timema) hypothetical protein n=1 Tax=Timema californicum TaxID=61474 RepID=A0A7R9JED2_TIMCA|nr:unnamed protein product [Timema californicum]